VPVVQIVLNLSSDLQSNRLLVRNVATNGNFSVFLIEGLPFIIEFAEGLMGGLGDAARGEIADAPFYFRKRNSRKTMVESCCRWVMVFSL
jgi:hypothetical protein